MQNAYSATLFSFIQKRKSKTYQPSPTDHTLPELASSYSQESSELTGSSFGLLNDRIVERLVLDRSDLADLVDTVCVDTERGPDSVLVLPSSKFFRVLQSSTAKKLKYFYD